MLQSHVLELRGMDQGLLAHEVVRQLLNCLEAFKPMSDFGWILRSFEDWGTKFVRILVKMYSHEAEAQEETFRKAWTVMRLVIEEAVHRFFSSYAENHEVCEAAKGVK